jgi:hypothetical protein
MARLAYLKIWHEILEEIYDLKCGICGKPLSFRTIRSEVVCFDHRGKSKISHPSGWLKGHVPSEENINYFLAQNFGILCHTCNLRIGPPEGRAKWLKLANQYIKRRY